MYLQSYLHSLVCPVSFLLGLHFTHGKQKKAGDAPRVATHTQKIPENFSQNKILQAWHTNTRINI